MVCFPLNYIMFKKDPRACKRICLIVVGLTPAIFQPVCPHLSIYKTLVPVGCRFTSCIFVSCIFLNLKPLQIKEHKKRKYYSFNTFLFL